MSQRFFVDRRRGDDRRQCEDQRRNPRLDLPHRRRRRLPDRRARKSRFQDFLSAAEFDSEDFSFLNRHH